MENKTIRTSDAAGRIGHVETNQNGVKTVVYNDGKRTYYSRECKTSTDYYNYMCSRLGL